MNRTNNINGTSLQGYLECSYKNLIEVLGEPHMIGAAGDKVDVEWAYEIDGVVFTIYNWKNGKCYNGDAGDFVENITSWNVGGRNKNAYYLAKSVTEKHTKLVEKG